MALTKPILLGDLAITVRELTVGEVRDWLLRTETSTGEDPVHMLAREECGLAELAMMTDVSVARLEAFAPSELDDLVATAKELNPHFFRVRAALTGVSRLMLEEAKALASTRPPAVS